MLPLRIAFDMDGTLADLESSYTAIENQLFTETEPHEPAQPEAREIEQHRQLDAGQAPKASPGRRIRQRPPDHRERVWRAIEATPDFWTTLKPIDAAVIKRLYALSCEHQWDVFFVTQRPATAGDTVQRQTHRWLVQHGFETPSVIPLSGGRGRAAAALQLDFLVDDTPQNCVDVVSDSSARAILIVDPRDRVGQAGARRLGIGTAHSIHQALDLLVQATEARSNPSLFEKLRKLVGWK